MMSRTRRKAKNIKQNLGFQIALAFMQFYNWKSAIQRVIHIPSLTPIQSVCFL